jgi:hypothetical protein
MRERAMRSIRDRLEQLKLKYAAPPPSLQVFFGNQQVAELKKWEGRYWFRYLRAFKELSLSPIPGFPDVDRKEPYESQQLFAFFRERIPDLTRPEIQELMKKLDLGGHDELKLLAELSKRSVTDPFELRLVSAG